MLTFEQVQPMQAAAPAAAPPVKLEVRNLTFRYGKTVALTDVSMGLHQNRVTAIMGPSGCGNSTLLRTFNRMYTKTQKGSPKQRPAQRSIHAFYRRVSK